MSSSNSVKREHNDDSEIVEMARQIAEQHRNSATVASVVSQANGIQAMNRLRDSNNIQDYFHPSTRQASSSSSRNATTTASTAKQASTTSETMDYESRRGRFGWVEFEKNYLPFILRRTKSTSSSSASSASTEQHVSVRMVERKLLSRYLQVLPPEVNSCHCIRSYYITEAECKLLNEINVRHSEHYYGKDTFIAGKDLVVKLADAKEFYRFLDLCYKKLVQKRSSANDRCGFFRINGESVVPYTVHNGIKYVPLFYFEGETEHLKLKSDVVQGWDLAYLKFCCKVQGIRNELFAADTCRVVALEEIKGHFPSGTTFEDYWPAKGSIEPVVQQAKQSVNAGNWTQKPAISNSNNTRPSSNAHHHEAYAASLRGSALVTNAIAGNFDANQQLAALYKSQAYQQLMAAASLQGTAFDPSAALSSLAASSSSSSSSLKTKSTTSDWTLTQIREYPVGDGSETAYKMQKALIDQRIVPCINVRPYVFNDLMMTLPDFVEYFCTNLTVEKARHILQDVLKVVLYKGNKGHQQVLRESSKSVVYEPTPLVLVKDIMTFMPQIKYMSESGAKRLRVS